ncbi:MULTISPECIES: hypothetical protein [unclassified Sphingobium]|uniref:hypothetical protein n=1 Tax=unclassified Sphingobium TaxID=2611147 RepID=UPI000D17376A|nr:MULTISPECIES: hypothetical protein [unclassified Sphingobium]MBG6119002.1 hypothetical protein [Sphingobium sp. JAI105]PSO09934.1 hypothetical protein C7E20_19970 [Sphingobium sp. AEW4]TWC98162.1 hypothetical protein FB595_1296 [Sphingobium sp. AEW010]TWD18224.1 hypothetical protein FB596_1306 [Sphingobium sp. AEW013]TWD20786.1 hypothetical protein FB594_13028 [Sphingobium sp. AEW001]
MLSLFLMAAQAASVAPVPAQCTIIAQKSDRGQELVGSCEKSAVMLGLATEFESATNAATGSVVAVVKRDSETHVLLVRPTVDGEALFEDITASLAKQVGRSPDARLSGLSIALKDFSEGGVIGVSFTGVESKSESMQSGSLSVTTLIANEARRAALPQEKPRVVNVVAEGRGAERK